VIVQPVDGGSSRPALTLMFANPDQDARLLEVARHHCEMINAGHSDR